MKGLGPQERSLLQPEPRRASSRSSPTWPSAGTAGWSDVRLLLA